MKKYILSLWAIIAVCLTACDDFKSANDAIEIAPITVSVDIKPAIENLKELKDLTIKFDNYEEDLHVSKQFEGSTVQVNDIVPGIYTISLSGTAYDTEGQEYIVSGNIVNKALYQADGKLEIPALGGKKNSPLIFKEIYYAGSPKFYFRDQFYELYNNSDETLYLDGIYFANLTPNKSTKVLPVWPESDGNNYAYAERVWKFPGSGKEYPLQPGESCVIAQFAVNHKLKQYNPNSPIDASSADFEFNMNNPRFPDQPAYNMVHVFYNKKVEMGTLPQYLTSVFGGAYVIFQIPEGVKWDPVNDPAMSTTDLSQPNSSTYYAKVPVKYVLDAVEAVDDESMVSAKRVPAVLDAGITYVGATYCGLGVCRKRATDASGKFLQRTDGTYFFQDTNNSTDDFDRGVVPELRRYGSKMPAWNHTKQQ